MRDTTLDLNRNQFRGPLPDTLKNLKKLTTLSLSGNFFTGANNEFSGRIPDINGQWKLDTLDLGSNMFVGSLPKLPTKLRSLTLSRSISLSILSLSSLNQLNISFNQLTSIEVNTHLGSGSLLQVLNAQRNRLQDRSNPAGLRTAVGEATSLFLDDNFLSGPIPQQFNSSGNRISGNLANNCFSCPVTSQFVAEGRGLLRLASERLVTSD
ncbi:hypothetical protein F3Y22_tig00112159pilonHSYRG00193 [Hibiscus syriacus]|uniref:Uncharacterized protein n=1 Tax=Hibiscus syriacus TaxID=106335 RepID=A0A6A2Y3M1_HIBSY|nr:hypothetical protein F3Y22_tig00112159pilonHSYRG00193 [Hibiscus syriacus]